MTKIDIGKLTEFNMTDYLRTPVDIQEYISEVLNDADPNEMIYALKTIRRALDKPLTNVVREGNDSD